MNKKALESSPCETLQQRLFALQDTAYRDFNSRLVPNVPKQNIIGVRMPQLRKLARSIDSVALLTTLPHQYFEENQLHAIVVSGLRDYDRCLHEVQRFLPHIDNWATCDALRPRCFANHTSVLIDNITRWLSSAHEYTVRFGIGLLEAFYLDEAFSDEHLRWVASLEHQEYYINMMQAWYFATALAKQWDTTLPILHQLTPWIRNKTIQKARESFRISDKHKQQLAQITYKSVYSKK